jgi:DEAD/DEAH box helicase domain-containing protein
VSSDNFVIVDTTGEPRVIGETDFSSGPSTLHPKAIYIVEAKLYQVERLDFEGRKAFVREIDCDYYTDAITYTRVTALDTFGVEETASHGEVHVVSRVVGFKKIVLHERERVGRADLPEQQMHDVASADDSRDGPGRAAYASDDRRRHRRAVVRDAAGRAAAVDVRRPRHRHLD